MTRTHQQTVTDLCPCCSSLEDYSSLKGNTVMKISGLKLEKNFGKHQLVGYMQISYSDTPELAVVPARGKNYVELLIEFFTELFYKI